VDYFAPEWVDYFSPEKSAGDIGAVAGCHLVTGPILKA